MSSTWCPCVVPILGTHAWHHAYNPFTVLVDAYNPMTCCVCELCMCDMLCAVSVCLRRCRFDTIWLCNPVLRPHSRRQDLDRTERTERTVTIKGPPSSAALSPSRRRTPTEEAQQRRILVQAAKRSPVRSANFSPPEATRSSVPRPRPEPTCGNFHIHLGPFLSSLWTTPHTPCDMLYGVPVLSGY